MSEDRNTGRRLRALPGSGSRRAGHAREEDSLGDSERHSFKIFQALPVAIVLATVAEGHVVEVNERFAELVGYSREELIGRTIRELRVWAVKGEGGRVLERIVREHSVADVESRFRRKSGELRDVSITAELVDLDGTQVVIGMMIDVTERKRMETEIKRSQEQLRLLGARLEQVREEERIRIAREIHDELGGFLTVLKLDVEALSKEPSTGSAAFRRTIESMQRTIVSGLGSVRRICSDLRPSILDHIGLSAAIEWQMNEWQAKTGVRCMMTSTIDDHAIDPGRATAAFRILQEALTNVARHAHATSVHVRVWTEARRLRLEVRDNGRGFSKHGTAESASLGVLGMKERVFGYGGNVEIHAAPGRGTVVDVSIPLSAAPQ